VSGNRRTPISTGRLVCQLNITIGGPSSSPFVD